MKPPSRTKAEQTDRSAIRIGALIPSSQPGWVEAGRHLLAGLELAVRDVNEAGGIQGRVIELMPRDTAADPQKAAAAVDELARAGVVALAGEYHSVVARAVAAKADILGLPFLCSSAVLDALTDEPTNWVARIAPPQSRGWRIYAAHLLGSRHRRIAVATQPSLYWASGVCILRDYVAPRGGTVIEIDMSPTALSSIADELVASQATAVLLLVGYPEPAISIVRAIRDDPRLKAVMIGAPAGQPEFVGWAEALGGDGAGIPFLQYLPDHFTPLGDRVRTALRQRLGAAPSFVAFEGYDTIAVLADMVRSSGTDPRQLSRNWSRVSIEGTRGRIEFSRVPGVQFWQWASAPVQIAERDPTDPERFRVLPTRRLVLAKADS